MNQDYGSHKGGDCVTCGVSSSALRSEVEVLKRRLLDRDVAIVQLEAQMAQECPEAFPQGQVAVLRAQCDHWQDKYDRLLEAHKRLQRVNQGLEDKLLRLVDRTESEKSKLTANTASLTTALTTAAQAINRLKQENERYKNDLNLAVQLLQCNPSKYSTHKLDSLPTDLQKKAKTHLSREGREQPSKPKPEMKVIKVPIPTFPPTAMVYSVNKYTDVNKSCEPVDAVSAAIMAAVLEERQRERAQQHCSTCSCGNHSNNRSTATTHNHSSNGDEFTDEHYPDKNNRNNGNNLLNGSFQSNGTDDHKNLRVKSALDIGTQTFPSYIGERGKVDFTCIYCEGQGAGSRGSSNVSSNTSPSVTSSTHSIRSSIAKNTDLQYKNPLNYSENKTSISSYSNKSPSMNNERLENSKVPHGSTVITRPRHDSRSSSISHGSAWDWSTTGEGHESASPSTPSSLISASLSYESETSNITSPLNSPERLQDISSTVASPASISHYSEGNGTSTLSSKGRGSLRSYNYDIYSTDVIDGNNEKASSIAGSSCISQLPRSKSSTVSPVTQSFQISNSKCTNSGSPAISRIPFNARSPYNDVFSPPIHRSPPLQGGVDPTGANRNILYGNIVSSTPTHSTTETNL